MTDILDLFKISQIATTKYVIPRIKSQLNREAYNEASCDIRIFLTQTVLPISISDLQREIELMIVRVPNRKFKFTLFGNPRKYYLLALEHALEISQSLQLRFVTGGEKVYLIPCKLFKKVLY